MEETQEAYAATSWGDTPEGIIDNTQPKYNDDRDLGRKEVHVHPEKEQLLEAARIELKQ